MRCLPESDCPACLPAAGHCRGTEQPDDHEYLQELAALVHDSARCDIGQTSPQPLLDVLAHAPHLLKARVLLQGLRQRLRDNRANFSPLN